MKSVNRIGHLFDNPTKTKIKKLMREYIESRAMLIVFSKLHPVEFEESLQGFLNEEKK